MQLDRPEWGFFEGIETNYRLTFQLPFILAKTMKPYKTLMLKKHRAILN